MLSTRIELVRDIIPTDFKSVASACSATIAKENSTQIL